jgi:hypothetical protein
MALTSWIPAVSAAAIAAVTTVVIMLDGRSAKPASAPAAAAAKPAQTAQAGPSAEFKAMEKELAEVKGNATVYDASPNATTFAPIQQSYNEAERLIKRLTDNDEKIKAGDIMKQIKVVRDKAFASEEARKKNKGAGTKPAGPAGPKPAGPAGPAGPKPAGP